MVTGVKYRYNKFEMYLYYRCLLGMNSVKFPGEEAFQFLG